MKIDSVKSALLGLSVGDALGVPVEFLGREQLKKDPVTGMRGFGTWDQPPGTWSDDSSLAFCLADSLAYGYNLDDIAQRFIRWYDEGFWGAHHKVFDVGITTSNSIQRLKAGVIPSLSGDFDEYSNGNGSSMRILPLVFYLIDKPVEERFKMVKEVSSITHMHFRSILACFIYHEYALAILKGLSKQEAYLQMQKEVGEFFNGSSYNQKEVDVFYKVLYYDISDLQEAEIASSGYVVHTLEASLWCVLTSASYTETVLKAVNLGGDTDTTATVAGGLAGLIYGSKTIPEEWMSCLARKDDIISLSERLQDFLTSSGQPLKDNLNKGA